MDPHDTHDSHDPHRETVAQLVEALEPWDALEAEHRAAALTWIRSGAPLCRLEPPDVPPMHLVSYFLPYDARRDAIMLVAHRKAGLDLPPGGHCEPGEAPWDTVQRECAEELGVPAVPLAGLGPAPLFVTVTQTRASHGQHTDVSLWHLLAVDPDDPELRPDPREFSSTRWTTLNEVLDEPIGHLDPHTHRFVRKLRAARESAER